MATYNPWQQYMQENFGENYHSRRAVKQPGSRKIKVDAHRALFGETASGLGVTYNAKSRRAYRAATSGVMSRKTLRQPSGKSSRKTSRKTSRKSAQASRMSEMDPLMMEMDEPVVMSEVRSSKKSQRSKRSRSMQAKTKIEKKQLKIINDPKARSREIREEAQRRQQAQSNFRKIAKQVIQDIRSSRKRMQEKVEQMFKSQERAAAQPPSLPNEGDNEIVMLNRQLEVAKKAKLEEPNPKRRGTFERQIQKLKARLATAQRKATISKQNGKVNKEEAKLSAIKRVEIVNDFKEDLEQVQKEARAAVENQKRHEKKMIEDLEADAAKKEFGVESPLQKRLLELTNQIELGKVKLQVVENDAKKGTIKLKITKDMAELEVAKEQLKAQKKGRKGGSNKTKKTKKARK